MKLRVVAKTLRLRLEEARVRLSIGVSRIRLSLSVPRIRLAFALGEFVVMKAFADAANFVDTLRRRFGKSRADTVVTTEVFRRDTTKARASGAVIDDGLGGAYFAEDYVVGAPDAQTYTVGPGFFITVGKVTAEAAVVADLYAPVYHKYLDDSASVADSVLVSPVVEEDAADTGAAGDVLTYEVEKLLADISAAASDGTLRSQGYTVDMSYFAEDYVGESRTF
jgi:hypothetical protein